MVMLEEMLTNRVGRVLILVKRGCGRARINHARKKVIEAGIA